MLECKGLRHPHQSKGLKISYFKNNLTTGEQQESCRPVNPPNTSTNTENHLEQTERPTTCCYTLSENIFLGGIEVISADDYDNKGGKW